MPVYVKHGSQNSFDEMNARIYNSYRYNDIVPGTGGKTIGEKVLTHRCYSPQFHPSDGSMLMAMEAITRWHPDGSFTKESPLNVPGLIKSAEKSPARMKGLAEWEALGFFPDPEDEEGGGN